MTTKQIVDKLLTKFRAPQYKKDPDLWAFTRPEVYMLVEAALKMERRHARFVKPPFTAADRKVLRRALNLAHEWESSLAASSPSDGRLQRATHANMRRFSLLLNKLETL